MTHMVYLDTETTGLDPTHHHVWEIAYAVDDGPILGSFVAHSTVSADPDALRVGQYEARHRVSATAPNSDQFEHELWTRLEGSTLVGANPAFDATFLKARWGSAPWKYRLLDVEAYAMGALGYQVPQGLKSISKDLRDKGYDIPEPDHTAAGDVAALRACHVALVAEYAS